MDKETYSKLNSTSLACNMCNYLPKNMPNLKLHLWEHELAENMAKNKD